MAVNTGFPDPLHLTVGAVSNGGTIPNYLGLTEIDPAAPSGFSVTLPPITGTAPNPSIIQGALLYLRNSGANTGTVVPSGTDRIWTSNGIGALTALTVPATTNLTFYVDKFNGRWKLICECNISLT
jgi:hypothetical protein